MLSNSYEFVAGQDDDRVRLDQFLASLLGGVSRMRIARLISGGRCLVNGTAKDSGYKMSAGDMVQVAYLEMGPTAMTPEPIPVEAVFEDEQIAVVVKPSGMLVHPTLGVKRGTLANALAYHFNKALLDSEASELLEPPYENSSLPISEQVNTWSAGGLSSDMPQPSVGSVSDRQWSPALRLIRPGIVHRLDRATSGLLVVAKTPQALSVLSKHFRKGKVKKRYLAVVQGEVEGDSGSISAPIGRDPERRPHWWVMETGRDAETNWRVLWRRASATLLELEPVTGRTNQLRIHCAYWGHPIMGDELYWSEGGVTANWSAAFNTDVASGSFPDERRNIAGRLLLHAWKLEFHHPQNGVWLEFTAPPPAEMGDIDNEVVLQP
ncbi:MAG TPA: RluA family pseudouridine synthase [Blastocatellia bacterium]|nr:RluA family pseudouridine synthase [Blastocatellia bacterium]